MYRIMHHMYSIYDTYIEVNNYYALANGLEWFIGDYTHLLRETFPQFQDL